MGLKILSGAGGLAILIGGAILLLDAGAAWAGWPALGLGLLIGLIATGRRARAAGGGGEPVPARAVVLISKELGRDVADGRTLYEMRLRYLDGPAAGRLVDVLEPAPEEPVRGAVLSLMVAPRQPHRPDVVAVAAPAPDAAP